MFVNLIRLCVFVGIITFGVRAILADLGMPGWSLMLGFAVTVGIAVSFNYLTNLIHYSMKLGSGVVTRSLPPRAGLVQYPFIQHP